MANMSQAVAILDVGGVNDQDERQTERVGEQVTLAAEDLLTGIIALDSASYTTSRDTIRNLRGRRPGLGTKDGVGRNPVT
jgi:hypothetical protein